MRTANIVTPFAKTNTALPCAALVRSKTMSLMVEGDIGVMADPANNAGNHIVPHHDAGTRISSEALNVGGAGGNARVGVEVNDTFVTEWQSRSLDPRQREVGFVSLGA